jgi:hypothetical protein
MSENHKVFEPEKYKENRLHTAPANPAPEPLSTPQNK